MVKNLKSMGPMSAEATVVRNYLDWINSLPWNSNIETDINLNKALKTFDVIQSVDSLKLVKNVRAFGLTPKRMKIL